MQGATRSFALVYLALTSSACMMDQVRPGPSVDDIRREAARDARLQVLEREHVFLMQQVATLSNGSPTSLLQAEQEVERDRKLAELSTQISAITQLIAAWREEDRPQPADPDARRIADQVSAEDRTAAIRKVQALIDTGRIKLTMRGGRIQLTQVRPLDATNPYEPPVIKPAPVPAPPPPPPSKRPIDRLGF